jgi:hypothetical protein
MVWISATNATANRRFEACRAPARVSARSSSVRITDAFAIPCSRIQNGLVCGEISRSPEASSSSPRASSSFDMFAIAGSPPTPSAEPEHGPEKALPLWLQGRTASSCSHTISKLRSHNNRITLGAEGKGTRLLGEEFKMLVHVIPLFGCLSQRYHCGSTNKSVGTGLLVLWTCERCALNPLIIE